MKLQGATVCLPPPQQGWDRRPVTKVVSQYSVCAFVRLGTVQCPLGVIAFMSAPALKELLLCLHGPLTLLQSSPSDLSYQVYLDRRPVTSSFTTLGLSSCTAQDIAVSPLGVMAFISAPDWKRTFFMSSWPIDAATIIAVWPFYKFIYIYIFLEENSIVSRLFFSAAVNKVSPAYFASSSSGSILWCIWAMILRLQWQARTSVSWNLREDLQDRSSVIPKGVRKFLPIDSDTVGADSFEPNCRPNLFVWWNDLALRPISAEWCIGWIDFDFANDLLRDTSFLEYLYDFLKAKWFRKVQCMAANVRCNAGVSTAL